MGVGSVKNRMEPAGKAAMSPAHLTGADRWGANRGPVPAKAGQPSIAGDRCCKLLFGSTGESLATTTLWSQVSDSPGRRSPNRLERGGLGTAISAKSADAESIAPDVP